MQKTAEQCRLKRSKHENFGSRFITPSKPIYVGDFGTQRKFNLTLVFDVFFLQKLIIRMLSMLLMIQSVCSQHALIDLKRLKYKIKTIRPKHRNIVPESSTDTGLDSVKIRRRISHALAPLIHEQVRSLDFILGT